MPTGRDAELVCNALARVGVRAAECGDVETLATALDDGAGAVLITEEALHEKGASRLIEILEGQPVWSDLPVIVFSSHSRNAETLLNTLGSRINATVVERPIRIAMLVSAVRAALRGRQRQYQTRDLLRRLEESDKQKDLFLATLSHELRTPLNSMLGWLQILRSRPSTAVDVDHALGVIERNAKAQSEMVSDILFVSQVVTGKLDLKEASASLAAVIKSAIEMMLPAAEAKQVQIHFDHEGCEDPWVTADVDRLRQVFLNLIANAVKFTPELGRIDITVQRRGQNAEISIRDNGRGIEPEVLPFIFEKFRQADNSFTRQVGGLGLGLAIVRHLVELHGGTVTAESDGLNRGANFVVTLPLLVHDVRSEEQSGIGRVLDSARERHENLLLGVRVLVVEDDADSGEMLALILNHNGARVATAKSASLAMQAMRDFRPQVLVSDIGLPKQDGYELIRQVRQLSPQDGGMIPAIALTGYASLKDRNAALDAGYQEHLPKPVETEKLIELIAALMRSSATVGMNTNP